MNDYKSILTSKLQSDSVEQRCSQYRQITDGQSLVAPEKVINSERILSCRILIKEHTNFCKEGLAAEEDTIEVEKQNLFNALTKTLDERSHQIIECNLDNVGA